MLYYPEKLKEFAILFFDWLKGHESEGRMENGNNTGL